MCSMVYGCATIATIRALTSCVLLLLVWISAALKQKLHKCQSAILGSEAQRGKACTVERIAKSLREGL